MYANFSPRLLAAGILLSGTMAVSASAAQVQLTVTNEQASSGLYFTPVLSVFHDGTFDAFDAGQNVNGLPIEALAEEGDVAPLRGVADAGGATTAVVTGPGGFSPPPVFDPGESTTVNLDVDPSQRFFSFFSMIIPSNDQFIGNDNPMAYEIFDMAGDFVGQTIQVFTTNVWDAGTEATGPGAAFNADNMTETPTNTPDGVVALAGDDIFLLNGQLTAAGSIVDIGDSATLLATITVSEVPLPAGAPLLLAGLAGLGFAKRRRKV